MAVRSVLILADDFVATRAATHRGSVAIFCEQVAPSLQTIGSQFAGGDSRLHGAARFVGVGTIAKSTKRSQIGDFTKQRVDSDGNIAYVERSYSRCIDYPTAASDRMK